MEHRKSRLSGAARREQLLDVCSSIVEAESFHAATINRVAADSGVTRTVVYQQFGSHAGMLVALIDRAAANAGTAFIAATTGHGSVPDFRTAMADVLVAVDADPVTWRLFLLPPEGGPPELYERFAQGRAVARSYIDRALREAGTTVADLDLTARTLHAVADEIVRLRLTDPDNYTTARLLAHVDDITRRWTSVAITLAPQGAHIRSREHSHDT